MQLIASKIASYSLGEADLLRRAMGKKIAEEMAKQQKRFLEGAKANGYDEARSEKLFDLMAEFAKYGFNKSHSAAYCVIAAQTAWLKATYPVEFYAALLSTEMSDTDKIVKYIKLCRRRGIDIQSPHINFSDYKFSAKGETLYYSLAAIKGVGQSAVEAIIEAREELPGKKFESLEQFFEVVDLRRVNKKVIECLIKAGAFDGFGPHRSQLFKGYEKFVDVAEQKRSDKEVGQESLFSLVDESEVEAISLPNVPAWARMTRLNYEKEVLGFFLSDHPLNGYEHVYGAWANATVEELSSKEHKKKIVVAGMIAALKEIITKKGTRMAFAQIEDLSAGVEVVIFPDTFASYESVLKEEVPVLVTGTLENKDGTCKIIAEKISTLSNNFGQAKEVTLKISDDMTDKLTLLQEKLNQFPGETRVKMELMLDSISKRVTYDIREPKGIAFTDEFLENMQKDFGRVDFIEVSQ